MRLWFEKIDGLKENRLKPSIKDLTTTSDYSFKSKSGLEEVVEGPQQA